MLERGAIWTLTDLFRSIRLQGKHPVDAINDPGLNLQFLAWEVMAPEAAVDFWQRCLKLTPRCDPGFSGFMEWREIADRPGDEEEAMETIKAMIAGQIGRLEELLEVHAEIAGEEAIERADAASFDPGTDFERLRRYQAAKSRELKQTLELFMKLRKESAAPPRESAIRKPGGEAPTGEAEEPRPGNASDAGVERGRSGPPKRERRPAPFILRGALEMALADGLADQVRELVRGQRVANPTATNVRSPRPQQVQSPPGTLSESGTPGANEAIFT